MLVYGGYRNCLIYFDNAQTKFLSRTYIQHILGRSEILLQK